MPGFIFTMTTSTDSISAKSATPPFRWLNPTRPTAFRVIVGLGIGALVLLLINLFTVGGLTASAWVWSAVAAVAAYILAEVLLVSIVVVGPLVGFIYGVIAWFAH